MDENLGRGVRYKVSSSGVDYTIDGLVNRIKSKAIVIPKFQRGYIWSFKQASKFIESLLLGLPVPGVFMSSDPDTGARIVIDGQQRLTTLKYFYDGIFIKEGKKRVFKLDEVSDEFNGLTFSDLPDRDKFMLNDAIIHATIIKQEDPNDAEGDSAMLQIFHRLNTGGTPLKDHQIRSALYYGRLDDLIDELSENEDWKAISGEFSGERDREMILRFIALYKKSSVYKAPMKRFLDAFMKEFRNPTERQIEEFSESFQGAIQICQNTIGQSAFRPNEKKFNAAFFDSIAVNIALLNKKNSLAPLYEIKQRVSRLVSNPAYIELTEKHSTRAADLSARFSLAWAALHAKSDLP